MDNTRRTFLQITAAAALSAPVTAQTRAGGKQPWYLRTYRWGQTNITEQDPIQYDIAWWRDYWKRTEVQGVIVNAGGIVAYYPSKFPLQYRAQFLNGRDLYGELSEAAHRDGLVVMARMDSNRTAEDFYQAHPTWFARMADGKPYRAADKYITCINSPYYDEYLPDVLREIIQRSKPEGITDNSWAGMGRGSICYCDNCQRKFKAKTGQAIPPRANWDDPVYREWILWNYARRTELWEFNNRVTQEAGGADCIWSGMNSGSVTTQAEFLPRPQGDLQPRAHHHAGPPAARRRHGLPAERRHRQAHPFDVGLGQAGAGKHGDVRERPHLLPRGEQARRRGAHVDDRRNGGRHTAVVASRGGLSRRSPHVPDRRACDEVAQGERGLPGESQAGGQRGAGVVAAEYGFLRPRERGRTGGCSLRRLRAGADPGAHSLPAGTRRRHRSRIGGTIGAGAGECRRPLRCGVRGDSPVRGARRFAGRHRGEHALQRMGRPASRFRPERRAEGARDGEARAPAAGEEAGGAAAGRHPYIRTCACIRNFGRACTVRRPARSRR